MPTRIGGRVCPAKGRSGDPRRVGSPLFCTQELAVDTGLLSTASRHGCHYYRSRTHETLIESYVFVALFERLTIFHDLNGVTFENAN
jgi:hypothetical protein